MLNAKENMIACIKGGNPDRYVNQYEGIYLFMQPGFVFNYGMPEYEGPEFLNNWGVTQIWPSGTPGGFPVHTPDKVVIKDFEDWDQYVKVPSLEFPDEVWAEFKAQYDSVPGDKALKAIFVAPGLFEMCHHLGSITECLCACMTNTDEMRELVTALKDYELELARLICEKIQPTCIFHHDDFGSEANTFLPPDLYREIGFVDAYREIYTYYHEHGVDLVIHHSDSYAANYVDFMIEMGIDVWQGPMHSNGVRELVEKYGDKITFMGEIDNKFVDFEGWDREAVAKVVRECVDGWPMKGYIPCITQGGPGSTFSGTYKVLIEEIDKLNAEKFGFTIEEIEEARLPLQILFG